MKPPLQRTAIALAAIMALWSLSGCSRETASAPSAATQPSLTSVTTSPSPTPGSPPDKPVMPQQAKSPDDAGQEAFIRYWYSAFDYAIATGDTEPMLSASTDDCGCDTMVGEIDRIYKSGGNVEGALHKTITTDNYPLYENRIAVPRVEIQQASGVGVFPDGTREDYPEDHSTFTMGLIYEDGNWRFHSFEDE